MCGRLLYSAAVGSRVSLKSVKRCFEQVRDLSLLIGVDCVVAGVYTITWLQTPDFNDCLPPISK